MRRIIIFLIGFYLLPTPLLAESELSTNPDGPVGSIILTCLGGIHSGGTDIRQPNIIEPILGDLRGHIFSVKMESPISNSLTLLLLFNYDEYKTIQTVSDFETENLRYNFTVLGGFKFFIKR